jgi:hypothetical protein
MAEKLHEVNSPVFDAEHIFVAFCIMWGPVVISWFINPITYSYIRHKS